VIKLIFLEKEIEKDIIIKRIEKLGLKIDKIMIERIENCYNTFRKQYNAECLLDKFLSKYDPIVLLITNKDIYANNLNFVFGLAYPYRGCIVSFYRLKSENEEIYKERIEKEITHELGHVFGLKHCFYPCVMAFSNSIYEVDIKSKDFCDNCFKTFKRNIETLKSFP